MPIGQADNLYSCLCDFSQKMAVPLRNRKILQAPYGTMLGPCYTALDAEEQACRAMGRARVTGGSPQSPDSPLSWATRVALNFRTLKRRKMTSSFLPELCLHRGDVYTLVDMKGRPHIGHLCPVEENPPYAFHPSLPGHRAQLWPGKGEAIRRKTMPFIFLPMSLSSIHPEY